MTLRRLGTRSAIAALAALISVLVGLSLGASASAAVKTFSPVDKTRKALIFKINGIDSALVRKATATLRHRGGERRRTKLGGLGPRASSTARRRRLAR